MFAIQEQLFSKNGIIEFKFGSEKLLEYAWNVLFEKGEIYEILGQNAKIIYKKDKDLYIISLAIII